MGCISLGRLSEAAYQRVRLMTGLATGDSPDTTKWVCLLAPHLLLAVVAKITWKCIPTFLEGTDKICLNRGSMDLRNCRVAPEDT